MTSVSLDPASGAPATARLLNVARLAYGAFAIWLLATPSRNEAVVLFVAGSAAVFAIVSDSRSGLERRLEARGIPTREAWVPILLVAALLATGHASWADIRTVLSRDADIVAFILSFAVISQGMSRCGFFNFMAYRLAERCRGNTGQLILYLFLLSSGLTYLTSNDIVIFTMTPIVIAVAFQTRIHNAKLLLLSQFVAANTVSMGLLIGSPTNIILGRATDLNFCEYFFVMIVPAVISVMLAFVVISAINGVVRRGWLGSRRDWSYERTYSLPRFTEYRTMTRDMRRWLGIFAGAIAGLAIATSVGLSLFWVAVPISVVGVLVLARTESAGRRDAERRSVRRTLRELPYGVAFFALAFFLLAFLIGSTPTVRSTVVPRVESVANGQSAATAIAPIAASGILVNTMNDLPASALVGEIVQRVEFRDPFSKILVLQGFLIGLNIATYVTPIGALAGIIWFQVMRRERRAYQTTDVGPNDDVATPSRSDMMIYGVANFAISCVVLGLINYAVIAVLDQLLSPPGRATLFRASWPAVAVGTLLVIGVPVAFAVTLRRQRVVLGHMVEVFVVLGRIRVWAARHRVAFASLVAGSLFSVSAIALYWSENFVSTHYNDLPGRVLFRSGREFVVWVMVFVESGFEQQRYPHSLIGQVVAATLALASLAVIIFFVRLAIRGADHTLRFRIGSGVIPTDRSVVLHASDGSIALVEAMLESKERFVVATGSAQHSGDLIARLDGEHAERSLYYEWDGGAEIVGALNLLECRELIMLSDTRQDDFENLAILQAIDHATTSGVDGAVGTYGGPVILVEVTIESMREMIIQRVGEAMRDSMRIVYLGNVFGKFVAAHYADDTSALGEFYSVEGFGPDAASALPIRLQGLALSFPARSLDASTLMAAAAAQASGSGARSAFDHRHPWEARIEIDRMLGGDLAAADGAVGFELALAQGATRATLGSYADAHTQRTPTQLIVAASGSSARSVSKVSRPPVLLGVGDLLEWAARRLLEAGAPALTIAAPTGYALPRDLAAEPRITRIEFADTHGATNWWDEAIPTVDRILIFDSGADYGFHVDSFLEHVSVAHSRHDGAQHMAPEVAVQCATQRRYEELRRYATDVVFDSNWLEASYFSGVARAFYLAVASLDRPEDESIAVLLAGADAAARALMRFDVRRAGSVEFLLPNFEVTSAVGMTIPEAMSASRVAFGSHSVVVAVAMSAVSDDRTQLVVTVVPSETPIGAARVIAPDDLLLFVPYL